MTLLCSSLLALLLLPLSLSCNSKRLPQEIRRQYGTVATDLDNSRENVITLLKNSPCPKLKQKIPSCTSTNNTDFVSILHRLTCKMKHLKLPHVDQLITAVLNSIQCSCSEKPTEGPTTKKSKKRSTARRRRENKESKIQKETKKLCRAKAFMAAMTECYEMLNAQESSIS